MKIFDVWFRVKKFVFETFVCFYNTYLFIYALFQVTIGVEYSEQQTQISKNIVLNCLHFSCMMINYYGIRYKVSTQNYT